MLSTIAHRVSAWVRQPRADSTRQRANQALAAATRAEQTMHVLADIALGEDWTQPGASYTDPVVARIQARKRRIEASGFELISGGAA